MTIQNLDAELSYIKQKFPDNIDPTISTRDFIDFDIEVSTSHGLLTTAGIIAEITGTQEEELEDEDDNEDDKDEDKLTAKQYVRQSQSSKIWVYFQNLKKKWYHP